MKNTKYMITYNKLKAREKRDIFKLAGTKGTKSRDLNRVKCIKSDNKVLVNDGSIKER